MITLIYKGIKKHIITLISIVILLFLIFFGAITALTIYQNSGSYVKSELTRLGYGDITAWVSKVNNLDNLLQEIVKAPNVEKVEKQELIFSGYSINGTHSDNEGQLLNYSETPEYHILNDDLTGYKQIDSIFDNQIYISPSMMSSYDVKIGDKVEFELARSGEKKIFTVAGFFEDPFMGSSMIDMKSFLINQKDFEDVSNEITRLSNSEVLARNGAMIHIFQDENRNLNITEFNKELITHTNIGNFTEFTYTEDTIYEFMMILQNIFIGFLISFVVVLLIVSIIVISHSISNTIENDQTDFGILKTVGYTSKKLRTIQIVQYGITVVLGILLSSICANLVLGNISKLMITSTGFIIQDNLPISSLILAFSIIGAILLSVIILKTAKISKIRPIEVISGETISKYNKKVIGTITQKDLTFDIAIRQLISGLKRYIGTFSIAILLTVFVLIVGRLDSWLGENGEGLMNAFSVADHDLGVQPLVHVDMDNVQDIIREYAEIENVYSLAMESVTVEGVSLTANIINDSAWFHILQGRTIENSNEIVVTQMVADDLKLKIGDTVQVNQEHTFRDYTVVGIYQCANEMGANIGMTRDGYARIGNVNSYIWCYHFVLSDPSHNEEIMKVLQEKYPMQMDVHTNSWSGLDGIVSTMNMLIIFMYIIVIIFILIVVALTTGKLLNFEQRDMGIYKNIGFTSNKLRVSFAIRFLIVAIIGSLVGIILSSLFGDYIIASMLKLFGIGEFISNISFANTIIPVVIITMIFGIFSYIFSKKIKKVSLIDLIKN